MMDTVVVSMGINRSVGWTVIVVVANDSRSMVVGVVSDIVVLVGTNSGRNVVVMVVMDMSMFTTSLTDGIGFISGLSSYYCCVNESDTPNDIDHWAVRKVGND
jgi:hypothetical protein